MLGLNRSVQSWMATSDFSTATSAPSSVAAPPATSCRNVTTDTTLTRPGCDDQFEFEFALDLLLDGFDRLRRQGWSSTWQPATQVVV
jgi:hypothetical protein